MHGGCLRPRKGLSRELVVYPISWRKGASQQEKAFRLVRNLDEAFVRELKECFTCQPTHSDTKGFFSSLLWYHNLDIRARRV